MSGYGLQESNACGSTAADPNFSFQDATLECIDVFSSAYSR